MKKLVLLMCVIPSMGVLSAGGKGDTYYYDDSDRYEVYIQVEEEDECPCKEKKRKESCKSKKKHHKKRESRDHDDNWDEYNHRKKDRCDKDECRKGNRWYDEEDRYPYYFEEEKECRHRD